MKKKILILGLTSLFAVGTIAGVALSVRGNARGDFGVKAEDDYTITFGAEDLTEGVIKGETDLIYSDKDVTLKTDQNHNDVVFHYDQSRCYSFNDNYYFDMSTSNGAVLYNKTEIRSMISLECYGAGDFTCEWGWEEVAGDIQYVHKESKSIGWTIYTFDFNGEYPNYFKIYPTDGSRRQLGTFVITLKKDCVHGTNPYTIKDGLYFKSFSTGYECTGFSGAAFADVVIPNQVNGLDVLQIAEKAFYKDTTIKSVVLPNHLKYVDDQAFDGCTKIESLTIPNTVTSIDFCAFRDLHSCASVTFESGGTQLLYLGQACFNSIGVTGTFTLPSRIGGFGPDLFEDAVGISAYALNSDNVVNNIASVVDDVLFYNDYYGRHLQSYPSAHSRTEYTIPSDVAYVASGDGMSDADNLVTLNVAPASGVTIFFRDYSAVSMNNLEHLNLGGEGKIEFDFFCLRYQPKLKDLVIPENVKVYADGLGQITNDTSDPLKIHLVASAIPSSWSEGWDSGAVANGYYTVDFDYVV